MTRIYLLLLGVILASCASSNNLKEEIITIQYMDQPMMSSDFIDDYELIQLEAPSSDAFIKRLDNIVFADDRIFIYDRLSQKVFAFNREGKFIKSTKNMIGRAANEYLQLSDIAVDNKEKRLFMQCDNPYCMMELDFDLNFVSKVDMDYYCNEIVVDDNYIYGILPPVWDSSQEQYDYLVAIDRKNIVAKPKVILRADNIYKEIGSQRALTSSDGIFACGRFEDVIYKIKDGEITETYNLDFGDRALPESFRSENLRPDKFHQKYENNVFGVSKVYASDSTIFFSTNQTIMFVLNRNSMSCKGYRGLRSASVPFISTFSLPVQGLNGGVIYQTDNMMFMGYYKKYKEGSVKSKLDDRIMDAAAKITEDSNPLLIVWKIK